MSVSGRVGKLMVDSGLSDILKHAFGGIDKMLSGKKFQNLRAFMMLTEELLRKHGDVETYEEVDAMLTDISNRSDRHIQQFDTAKIWVEIL